MRGFQTLETSDEGLLLRWALFNSNFNYMLLNDQIHFKRNTLLN